MDNVIKSFQFESERVILILYIKKEIYGKGIKMYIDADIINNNENVELVMSDNISSRNKSLKYLQESFFWISYNPWKGMRWEKYSKETGFRTYNTIEEMKDLYIEQRKFINLISEYFYDSIKRFKKLQLLYDTQIDEIIIDKE
ncbi:hypothetical protein [Flavobacterium capsici]|uniref:Uncharacterized protein n=1 Tax=Flavobacterium capsici TaxID=3075618 RepID=A0AA96F1L3_9FLAO|nr:MULTISPECIES: hypothetical protein [unclassified Flavobacterium]WNM17972.1 hypothetical protein RN608_08095 [Flavobacterium sp. PMR2A8]WNM22024.1 hypothetical protein RN605_01395 [Flavobacterium sp. PMTSA4]